MPKDEIIKQVPQAWELQPESVPFKPILARWLILVGSPCTAVVVAVLSMDWCSTTFHSVWMSALLIWLVDEIGPRRLALRRSWGRQAQWLGVLVVVIALGLVFRVNAKTVFVNAFGMAPPPGVHNATVDANLRFVDSLQLMRFTADQATIDQIVARRKFGRNREDRDVSPQNLSWESLWVNAFGSSAQQGGDAWKNVKPMAQPVLYFWESQWPQEDTTLLWDAQTGQAYVMWGTR